MTSATIVGVLIGYLILLLAIGFWSSRESGDLTLTGQDVPLAGESGTGGASRPVQTRRPGVHRHAQLAGEGIEPPPRRYRRGRRRGRQRPCRPPLTPPWPGREGSRQSPRGPADLDAPRRCGVQSGRRRPQVMWFRSIPFFAEPAEEGKSAAIAGARTFGTGVTIVREREEPGPGLYLVQPGEVTIRRSSSPAATSPPPPKGSPPRIRPPSTCRPRNSSPRSSPTRTWSGRCSGLSSSRSRAGRRRRTNCWSPAVCGSRWESGGRGGEKR